MFPLRDSIPSRTVPVVTRALVVLNVLVFVGELALPREALEQAFYIYGIVPARLTHPGWAAVVGFPAGSWWSLLTYQFLHAGWLHVLSNLWALWIFGDNVEDAMGHARFALFYVTCGVAAGLAQWVSQPNATVPSLGASGAIAGVLGAYLVWYPFARVLVLLPVFVLPLFFEVPAVIYLGAWFVSQLFNGTLALAGPVKAGGIAFWAHIGGFVAGMALCGWFARRRSARGLEPATDDFADRRRWWTGRR
jgi:membrane associated rhomboid family serine protease